MNMITTDAPATVIIIGINILIQAKALTTVGVLCFFYGGNGYDDNRNAG